MWYKVSRTSLYSTEEQPCEGCVKRTYDVLDERDFKSVEQYDKCGFGSWVSRGTNHGFTETGNIIRKIGTEECWAINIKTLKQLKDFVTQYGRVVLSEDTIEIYDYYRE